MVDREREHIECMIRGMSLEEKIVAWNVLKDDENVVNVLAQVAKDDPGPVTIEKLLQVAKRKVEK